jgi:NDP-sugar pyrophosphorylase family protein
MSRWPPPALVLTAGLGTRLRPLSDYRAKPAMPVGKEALVCRILRHLTAAGITDAVLNLHHLPATITREVGDGSQLGLRVRYSWEQPRVLGSAGGPRHALPLVDADDLLIVNGDTLCDLPLRALWDAHASSGALVTLGLMPHPAPGRYGGVVLDDAGRVTGFTPRTSPVPSVHFPGVQLIRREVLAPLADDTVIESVLGIYPALIAERLGTVCGAVFDVRFDDVGTVEDYRRTCQTYAADADGNVIDPTAVIASTATLRDTIVWPGATVPDGAVLTRVVVTGHAALLPGSQLDNTVA